MPTNKERWSKPWCVEGEFNVIQFSVREGLCSAITFSLICIYVLCPCAQTCGCAFFLCLPMHGCKTRVVCYGLYVQIEIYYGISFERDNIP